MFGTLKLSSERHKSPEFIKHARSSDVQQVGGYVFSHSACDPCRAKKLRCSGQKSGCDRCKSVSAVCTYEGAGKGRAHQKSSTHGSKCRKLSSTASGSRDSSNGPEIRKTARNSISNDSQKLTRHRSNTSSSSGLASNSVHDFNDFDGTEDQVLDFGLSSDPIVYPFTDRQSLQRILDECPEIDDLDTTNMILNDVNNEQLGLDHACMKDSSDLAFHDFPLVSVAGFAMSESPASSNRPEVGDFSPGATNTTTSSMTPPPKRDSPFSGFSQTSISSSDRPTVAGKFEMQSQPPSLQSLQRANSASRGVESDQGRSNNSCECLASMLCLLEEIENRATAVNANAIDSTLAWHKYALSRGNEMLKCPSCRGRSDYMSLLAVVGDKLAALSEKVVGVFISYVRDSGDQSGRSRATSGSRIGVGEVADGARVEDIAMINDGLQEWRSEQNLRLGEFEVETHSERACVMAALIQLQLKELVLHVRQICVCARRAGREAQIQMLRRIEKRLMDMYREMQRVSMSFNSSGPDEHGMDSSSLG